MSDRWKHRHRHTPLTKEAHAWEMEQLQALGLELVPWDPEIDCPWCREGNPHPEEESSGPPIQNRAGRTKRRNGWNALDRMVGMLLLGIALVVVIVVLIAAGVSVLRGR